MDSKIELSERLACPGCKETLARTVGLLSCMRCGKDWPIVDRIPRFNDQPYYWGEIPQPDMVRCLQIAETSGWRTAITDVSLPISPDLQRYIIDDRRVNWFYLLENDVVDVLDLGAGWGTITAHLAPHVRSVVALEAVPERVEFLALRCRQDSLDNVFPIQSDFHAVPFKDSSFDLIVANGVLEWVALVDEVASPRQLQRRFLEKMFWLLRPGGRIYIGIENRFAYSNFLGARDHSGLSFTALLPRAMADLVTRSLRRLQLGAGYRTDVGQAGYRTYTYSLSGYAKLLREAGFTHVEPYAALPSYNDPRYLVSLATGDRSAIWQHFVQSWAQPKSAKQQALLSAANLAARLKLCVLIEAVVPAYSIFAQRT